MWGRRGEGGRMRDSGEGVRDVGGEMRDRENGLRVREVR